jgi:hypothetical protein
MPHPLSGKEEYEVVLWDLSFFPLQGSKQRLTLLPLNLMEIVLYLTRRVTLNYKTS